MSSDPQDTYYRSVIVAVFYGGLYLIVDAIASTTVAIWGIVSVLDYRSFVIVVGVVVGLLVYVSVLFVTRQEPCCVVNVTTTASPSELF